MIAWQDLICCIEKLEELLQQAGGYILIPEEKRRLFLLSDGVEDTRTAKLQSIVWVCENIYNDEFFIRIKAIDTDGDMWDVEEYMAESDVRILIDLLDQKEDKVSLAKRMAAYYNEPQVYHADTPGYKEIDSLKGDNWVEFLDELANRGLTCNYNHQHDCFVIG